MEKRNGTSERVRRERGFQSDDDRNWSRQADFNQERNQEHEGNRPYSGLGPNYESNYRPGEYDQYSNRNQFNRPGNNTNDWSRGSRDENAARDFNRREGDFYQNMFRGDYNSGFRNDEDYSQYRENRDDYGQHRGKGPKGYSRTDERIKEDVNDRLTEDGHVDASEIEIDVRNGEVVLKGTVRTKQQKRRTEDIIDRILGVKNVENHLKVDAHSSSSDESRYTNGQREKRSGLEYGPGAVSGMGNTSATGDFNTAR
jgi:hypothetical protein